MNPHRSRRTLTALAMTLLSAAAVGVQATATAADAAASTPAASAGDPPPNPSNGQLSAAEQAKQAAAAQLGALKAQAAQLQTRIDGLQTAADAKAAQYEKTTRDVAAALDAAATAATDLAAANRASVDARARLNVIARDMYQNGASLGGAAALLVSPGGDAEFTIAAATYLANQQAKISDAVTRTAVASANAEAARRAALANAERLQRQADTERAAALTALDTATATRTQLQTELAQVNQKAATTAAALSGLQNQRAAYNNYLTELARQEAARREAARQAALRAAAAAAAAAAANRGDDNGPTGSDVGGTAPAPVAGGTWTRPLTSYSISSCYCARWGSFHRGLDMPAPLGTTIYAVGPGTVVRSGPASGFGNWVVIDHGDGTFSVYGHMRYLIAREGQRVVAGTPIAYVGNEGQSTGPHLHFEVRIGGPSGTSTDPVLWLRRRGVSV